MAHISSIGAAVYSDISVAVGTSIVPATYDSAGFAALFATADTGTTTDLAIAGGFARIQNIRAFPAMGTPPNIIKVPVYGSRQSRQIQGQADAPTMEIELNYVASDWYSTAVPNTALGALIGNSSSRAFRFTLMATDSTGITAATKYASTALGIGTQPNSVYYWIGKMEALLITPSLTDALTAKLTLSMQSDFYGAYTY